MKRIINSAYTMELTHIFDFILHVTPSHGCASQGNASRFRGLQRPTKTICRNEEAHQIWLPFVIIWYYIDRLYIYMFCVHRNTWMSNLVINGTGWVLPVVHVPSAQAVGSWWPWRSTWNPCRDCHRMEVSSAVQIENPKKPTVHGFPEEWKELGPVPRIKKLWFWKCSFWDIIFDQQNIQQFNTEIQFLGYHLIFDQQNIHISSTWTIRHQKLGMFSGSVHCIPGFTLGRAGAGLRARLEKASMVDTSDSELVTGVRRKHNIIQRAWKYIGPHKNEMVWQSVFATHTNLGWRTKDQMMVLHGNNETLVDSIIERKLQRGEYKEHPDCPGEESGWMYYVMIDLSQAQEDRVEERVDITADVSLELGSQARQLIKLSYLLYNICILLCM